MVPLDFFSMLARPSGAFRRKANRQGRRRRPISHAPAVTWIDDDGQPVDPPAPPSPTATPPKATAAKPEATRAARPAGGTAPAAAPQAQATKRSARRATSAPAATTSTRQRRHTKVSKDTLAQTEENVRLRQIKRRLEEALADPQSDAGREYRKFREAFGPVLGPEYFSAGLSFAQARERYRESYKDEFEDARAVSGDGGAALTVQNRRALERGTRHQ